MTRARLIAVAAALAAGCDSFDPSFEDPRCGPGGECPDGLACIDGTCRASEPEICGDGVMVGSEACDDGNLDDGDGCNATCTVASCFVPSTHATVAAGLADAACPTLFVYSGTYTENVTISRDVTVLAVGAEPVLLDGGGAGTVVTVELPATATLRGFTIRNGRAESGGGIVNQGALTLDAMTVADNAAVAEHPAGGGILNAGTLTLAASVVTRNRLSSTAMAGIVAPTMFGAGIRSTGGAVRLERESRVEANEIASVGLPGASGAGGGIAALNTEVHVTGASAVRANVLDIDGHPGSAFASGAGLLLSGGRLTLEAGSAIEDNTATARGVSLSMFELGASATGGGLTATSTQIVLDTAFLRNNQAVALSERSASARAGGGTIRDGSLAVTGTAITGNTARAEGLGATSESASASVGGLILDGLGALFSDSQLSSNVVAAGTESASSVGSASVGALSTTTFGTSRTVTFLRCTFDGNTVTSSDGPASTGALSASLGTGSGVVLDVNFVQSTISNNVVTGVSSAQVGAAMGSAGTGDTTVNLNLVNSTVSGNRAEAPAGTATTGAILGQTSTGSAKVNVNLASATITANRVTGATAQYGGLNLVRGISSSVTAATLKNSIVAGNTAPVDPDCRSSGAPVTSGGYNLVGNAGSCTLTGTLTGNRSGAAGLAPLAANGGPTRTHALQGGSQAINTANPAGCTDLAGAALATDQRSLPRASGGRCDIGAFEL